MTKASWPPEELRQTPIFSLLEEADSLYVKYLFEHSLDKEMTLRAAYTLELISFSIL